MLRCAAWLIIQDYIVDFPILLWHVIGYQSCGWCDICDIAIHQSIGTFYGIMYFIIACVAHHWLSIICIKSYIIQYFLTQPPKKGQAKKIRLPWLDKQSNKQSSHVCLVMPSSLGHWLWPTTENSKNKN